MSEGLRLDGELALVTGASRGIGKAIVLALGRQGATVVGTATSTGGAEAIFMLELVGDRASKIFHDRPAGVGTELVSPGIVKFLDGANQRHVAVADQSEELFVLRHVPFGNRDDQSQIRLHDLVLNFHCLVIKPLDFVHQRGLRLLRIELLAKFRSHVLQEVKLAKQVAFLLAR